MIFLLIIAKISASTFNWKDIGNNVEHNIADNAICDNEEDKNTKIREEEAQFLNSNIPANKSPLVRNIKDLKITINQGSENSTLRKPKVLFLYHLDPKKRKLNFNFLPKFTEENGSSVVSARNDLDVSETTSFKSPSPKINEKTPINMEYGRSENIYSGPSLYKHNSLSGMSSLAIGSNPQYPCRKRPFNNNTAYEKIKISSFNQPDITRHPIVHPNISPSTENQPTCSYTIQQSRPATSSLKAEFSMAHPYILIPNPTFHQKIILLNRKINKKLVEIDEEFFQISPLRNRFGSINDSIYLKTVFSPFIVDKDRNLKLSACVKEITASHDRKNEIEAEYARFSAKVSAETPNYLPLLKEQVVSSELYAAIRGQKLQEYRVMKEVHRFSKKFTSDLNYEEKLMVLKIEKEMNVFAKKWGLDDTINRLFPEIKAIFALYYKNYDEHTLKNRSLYGGIYLFRFISEKIDLLKANHADLEKNPRYLAKLILLIRAEYVLDLLKFININSYHLVGYLLLCIKSYSNRLQGVLNESEEFRAFMLFFKSDVLETRLKLVNIYDKISKTFG